LFGCYRVPCVGTNFPTRTTVIADNCIHQRNESRYRLFDELDFINAPQCRRWCSLIALDGAQYGGCGGQAPLYRPRAETLRTEQSTSPHHDSITLASTLLLSGFVGHRSHHSPSSVATSGPCPNVLRSPWYSQVGIVQLLWHPWRPGFPGLTWSNLKDPNEEGFAEQRIWCRCRYKHRSVFIASCEDAAPLGSQVKV